MYNNDEYEFAAEKLLSEGWTFAKTMPKDPHWYTLRKNWANEEFIRAVKAIRSIGYTRRWWGKAYISLNINDFYYWTMGNPIDVDGRWETTLINRAKNPYTEEKKKRGILSDLNESEIVGFFAPVKGEDLLADEIRLSDNTQVMSLAGKDGAAYGTVKDYFTSKKYKGIFAVGGADKDYTVGRILGMLAVGGRAYIVNPYDVSVEKIYKEDESDERCT